MTITVNGKPREVGDGISVAQLIAELGFSGRRVAVEINEEIVPRASFETHVLREKDVVELVQFMAGG